MNHTRLARSKWEQVSYLAGGEGAPLLLLHGIPGSAYSWEGVGRRLTQSHRVIIPDLRGFGQSRPLESDFYMEAQAASLREFLGALGVEQLAIGAHDFGGPVALTLRRMYPELRITKLILSATNLFTDTYVPVPLRIANVPVLGKVFFKALAGNRIGLLLMYVAATRNKETYSKDAFERHLTPSGMDLTWRIFQRSLADLEENYRAIEETLSDVGEPTLILWGNDDPFFSLSVAEHTRGALRNATLKVYPGTGHFVPEERPEQVAQDVQAFLSEDSMTTSLQAGGGAA